MRKIILTIIFSFFIFFAYSQSNTINTEVKTIINKLLTEKSFDKTNFLNLIKNYQKDSKELTNLYNNLLNSYNENYLTNNNKRIPYLEDLFKNFYTEKQIRDNIFDFINKFVFNEYIESELKDLNDSKQKYNDYKIIKDIEFLTFLYNGLKTYNKIINKTKNDWDYIYFNLKEANKRFPIEKYNYVLLDVYKNLSLKREYFELRAFEYYNNEDPSIFKNIDLFFLYSDIKDKKDSFFNEKDKIIYQLRLKVFEYARKLKSKDKINEEILEDVNNNKIILNTQNKTSPFYNKKIILVFFNTDCTYCKKEMKELVKINNIIKSKKINAEIIGVTTVFNNEDYKTIADISILKKENNINFNLLMDKNNISVNYNIPTVPTILLIDENNNIREIIRFKKSANLKMKLKFFLDTFLNITI